MFGFGHYPFKDSEEAYKKFAAQIKTPMFREPLEQYYASVQRLKPGATAPTFTLKDIAGKNVSLSNFKGKVVYIDFWGVGCGPCIYDIKNYAAQMHEKYKNKDVVFVNICVDVKEKEWKENITKLKLEGVNLLAEGWTAHPVCKDYNVTGIPHYILIDQKGNIVNNNAGRMEEILGEHENQIDKLLK
jgi:peroxiredoxin